MPNRCPSCPFNPKGDVQTRMMVTERCLSEASQICHHPRLKDKKETHLCRGARDVQLRVFYEYKFIDAPTDEAWDSKRRELGLLCPADQPPKTNSQMSQSKIKIHKLFTLKPALSLVQIYILQLLRDKPEANFRSLSLATGMSAAGIKGHIDRLVTLGLLERLERGSLPFGEDKRAGGAKLNQKSIDLLAEVDSILVEEPPATT